MEKVDLTYRHTDGKYLVYLDGKFFESCMNYQELREVYARFNQSI